MHLKLFKNILSVFLLSTITFLTFSSALQNDFVNYDDAKYIANNPVIKALAWPNIQQMFSNVFFQPLHYLPLTLLSWTIEYHFVKLTPHVYIFNNIILHTANTLLIFWLVSQLTQKIRIAFLAALLFGIHPLRVESVVWITERKDVLYSFFYLLGLNAYTKWIFQNRKGWALFFITHIFFILSCLSKPMAVSFPLALLTLDFLNYGKIRLKDISEKIFLFGLAAIFGSIAIFQNPMTYKSGFQIYTLWDRSIVSVNSCWFYLSKIFWPINLSCFYPLPQKINDYLPSNFYIVTLISFLFFPLMILIKKTHRLVQWGLLFYCSTIFFILGLFSFTYFIAERYTYIPSIGIAIICAWGINQLIDKTQIFFSRCFLVVIVISTLLTLSMISFKRAKVWHDGISLWTNVLKQFPKAENAHSNLGNAYWKIENYRAALKEYSDTIALNPQAGATLSNRGAVYIQLGEYNLALQDFNKAIEINPSDDQAFNNRGGLFYNTGHFILAIQDFDRSIQLNPGQVPAYVNRSKAYKQLGNDKKAQEDDNQAFKINPDFWKYKPQF